MLLLTSDGICCCLLINYGQTSVSVDCTGACCLISTPKDGIRDRIAMPQQSVPFLCQLWSSFSFSGSKFVGLGSYVPFPEPASVVH